MKYNLLICLLILAFSILFLTGCIDEDPCPGEPSVISYNEPINIRLSSSQGGYLFDSLRPINGFVITEHGDTISYKHKSFKGDTLITFSLRRFSAAYIWESFGTIMTSKVILGYDSLRADTLHFSILPRFYENQCNKTEYEKSEILLNGEIVRRNRASNCFMCGDTLLITLEK
jgi:hypothetical protein